MSDAEYCLLGQLLCRPSSLWTIWAAWGQAVGSIAAVIAAFLIGNAQTTREEQRRLQNDKNLLLAIYHELANRAARCCFDFESPWSAYLTQPQAMDVFRLRKFAPELPILYGSAGTEIGSLKSLQSVIVLYFFLAAWKRDLENVANECDRQDRDVSTGEVEFLARRLRHTLEPAKRALAELGSSVTPAAAQRLELDAIAQYFSFPENHPNTGRPLRERIDLILNSTPGEWS